MSKKALVLLTLLALSLGALATALAGTETQAAPGNPDASYAISWWTVDDGGGASQGDPYALSGTIGQPDAGSMAGGTFTLQGGFWSGLFDYLVYLPLVNR